MVISNKCKNCGGELFFDVDSQNLKCTHCSTITEFKKDTKTPEKKLLEKDSTITESKTKYTQYSCQTCGRKHLSPTDTPLLRCPSCGADNLVKTLKIEYTPDGIIPFKLSKESAIMHFSKWVKHRYFAPNALKKMAKSKVLTPLYLPSYFFDFDTETEYSGVGVNTYKTSSGNFRKTRHSFHKKRKDIYKNRLESASANISSFKMRQLGSFPEKEISVYRPEFLYGLFAEKVDTKIVDSGENMKRIVSQEISRDARSKLGYTYVENFSCKTKFSDILYSYVYLPVYKGLYRFNKKDYVYYINGINGTVTGKSPKSFWKIFFLALVA